MFSSAAGLSGTRNCPPAVTPAGTITLTSAPVWGFLTLILLPGPAPAVIGAVVILGLVLWSCYCCESCPMYDHWNPRAKEKRNQNLQQPIIGGTYQQPTQVGTVVP